MVQLRGTYDGINGATCWATLNADCAIPAMFTACCTLAGWSGVGLDRGEGPGLWGIILGPEPPAGGPVGAGRDGTEGGGGGALRTDPRDRVGPGDGGLKANRISVMSNKNTPTR